MTQKLPDILHSKQPPRPEEAFAGDLFQNRRSLADQLTRYFHRLQKGAVIAMDAPWGSGKTWFGRHWKKYLEEEERDYSCLYIDAFRQDYVDDPFMLLTAELLKLIDDKDKGDFKEKATKVMRAIAPVMGKATVDILGRVLIGNTNLSGNLASVGQGLVTDGADAVSTYLTSRLDNYAAEKKSLEEFRLALAEFTEKQEKPVVIFVDELDRCRPDFAVHLLEYLKHFFDVENLIFVLLMNRPQLEGAIRGIYGQECDAEIYLGKFVNLFVSFPDRANERYSIQTQYVHEVAGRINMLLTQHHQCFVEYLAGFATWFDLSLRQIEQAVLVYALHERCEDIPAHELAYLLAMKMACPTLFKKIASNDPSGHKEAVNTLNDCSMSNIVGTVEGASKQEVIGVFIHAHHMAMGEEIDDKKAQQLDLSRHAKVIQSGVWQ